MTKKYLRLVYLALLLALIFPVVILGVADEFSTNVVNGLTMILILSIFVGLFSARYMVSWLIIILTTIAVGFLLLGYVVMPSAEKLLLIITFPVEASLLSVVRHHILHWNIISGRDTDVRRHISHYDLNVKLQTYYNANKFYSGQLKKIKQYSDLDLWSNTELISWDRHRQVEENHPEYHARILREISRILKETRLKSEFIYYIGDGMFLVISPRVTDEMYEKLNEQAHIALQNLDVDIPLMLKVATQKVNLQNSDKFPTLDKLLKYLERGLETDIIVEYLKEHKND